MIGNGGLGNSVTRQELEGIFSIYGMIVDIVMQPQKPYAFVSYTTVEEAKTAFQAMHGEKLTSAEWGPEPGIRLYLSYVLSGGKCSCSFLHVVQWN